MKKRVMTIVVICCTLFLVGAAQSTTADGSLTVRWRSDAEANLGLPYPPNCSVAWINPVCGGTKALICPNGDGSSLEVTVRDAFNAPISGATVTAALATSCDTCMCGGVKGTTNGLGVAILTIHMGLDVSAHTACCVVTATVSCMGITLATDTRQWLTPDLDGDCWVDYQDRDIFWDDWETAACRSDFDCDGTVYDGDYSVFMVHWGHACPTARHPHHPEILSVSQPYLAFGRQSVIVFCIVNNEGKKIPDDGVRATVSSRFGLGTLGTVTGWADTTYSVTYTAGYALGTDSISVYDPECAVEQYAWTTVDIIIPAPKIVSVEDVPGDQGGKVTVRWTRSGLDVTPDSIITYYSVWRSLDGITAERLADIVLVSLADVGGDFAGPGYRVTNTQDRTYYWEWIGNVPAHYFEGYSFASPTLMDSTGINPGWHYFLVSAHTRYGNVFRDSEVDSGYSVDNLSPNPPQGLAGEYSFPPARVLITWRHGRETDISHYVVYKGDNESFVPNEANRAGTPADTFFVDTSFDPGASYYKVGAWDIHQNESGYSLLRPEEITGVSHSPTVPTTTQLEQNVPNPFNPMTVIRFAVAKPGWVKLVVYDVTGRPVRVLVNGVREASRYEVRWDGRDDSGVMVASGVYMYVLDAPGYSETKKMVLLK